MTTPSTFPTDPATDIQEGDLALAEMEVDEVRKFALSNRPDHLYSDQRDLTEPLVVLGTRKTLVAHPGVETPANIDPQQEVEGWNAARAFEQSLTQTRTKLRDLTLTAVTETHVILRVADPEIYLTLRCPDPLTDPPELSAFVALIGIPYAYAKKNPGTLNHANIHYHLTVAAKTTDPEDEVLLIHRTNPEHHAVTEPGSTISRQVTALPIFTFITAGKRHPLAGGASATTELAAPTKIHEQITAICAEQGLPATLVSRARGYDGSHKGTHTMRYALGGEHATAEIAGDTYQLGLDVIAKALRKDTTDGGDQVAVRFILYRLVCANGMTMELPAGETATLADAAAEAAAQRLPPGSAEEDRAAARARAAVQFHILTSPDGMKVPVAMANDAMRDTPLGALLPHLVTLLPSIATHTEEQLTVPLDTDTDELVSTIEALGKANKVPGDILKWALCQLVASADAGEPTFRTPLDVLNFVTLTARAYDAATAVRTEAAATAMAYALAAATMEGAKVPAAARYRRYINPDLDQE